MHAPMEAGHAGQKTLFPEFCSKSAFAQIQPRRKQSCPKVARMCFPPRGYLTTLMVTATWHKSDML